jgi:RND family efflux transporter MFP subunit
LACATVLLLAAAGCQRDAAKQPETKAAEVQVSAPVLREITDYEDFSGQIDAFESVSLQARVTGYLVKANFKEGMAVKAGDVLFEIDRRPFEAEKEKSDAALLQANAKLERLTKSHERAEGLINKGSLSQEEYDKARGEYLEAKANLKAVTAQHDIAQLNLEYCTIKAPLDGKISRRLVDPGNLIKADTTILTTVVSQNPVQVYFNLDERTLLKIQRLVQAGVVGSPADAVPVVRMGLADDEDFPYQGKLDFVDNALNPDTGTLEVRAVFDNSKGLLFPGLFARVRLPIGPSHKALLVSERALGTDQGQKFVYVVNDANETVYRKVKVGALHNGLRVIEKGLDPGERVIVSGVQKLRAKQKVNPKAVEMPALATLPTFTFGPALAADGKAPTQKTLAP